MIKKLLVSTTFFLTALTAQANIILSGFYMDAVDENVGGFSTVYWGWDGSNWAHHFAVYVAPSASIIGSVDPDYTIPGWISPVANGGATFQPVELFARWGPNNEVFASSMGNGFDASLTGWNIIIFPPDQTSWDVTLTPVTSVPEPETYAMLLAGLGVMGAMARRRKAKQA